VPDLENIDVTNTVPGHLQYRAFMPLVLDQLGFRTTADYFDEPEVRVAARPWQPSTDFPLQDMANIPEREIVREAEALAAQEEQLQLKTVKTKTGGFGKIFRRKGSKDPASSSTSGTSSPVPGYQASATAAGGTAGAAGAYEYDEDEDDLPPREASTPPRAAEPEPAAAAAAPPSLKLDVKPMNPALESARAADNLTAGQAPTPEAERPPFTAVHFDTEAILAELKASGVEVRELESSLPPLVTQAMRSEPERPKAQPAAPSAATTRFDAKHAPAASAVSQPQPPPLDTHSRESSRSSLPTRPPAAPAPYARSFNQSPFSQLPPPAPPALPLDDGMGGVSLSFAENYDDDEDEAVPESSAPAPPLAAPSLEAAKGYGLSSDAAAELARRFQGGAAASSNTAAPIPVDDGWGHDAASSSQTSSRAASPPRVKPLAALPADAPDWSSAEQAGGDTSFDSTESESSIAAPPRSLSFGRLATEDPSDATGTPSFTPLNPPANAWSSGADNPWG
jgi:hypothetical protein